MKPVATIILNRNLPDVTDKLYEQIVKYNKETTDVFVVESGSDNGKLSKYSTWWANWPEAVEKGLRYPRGFNYALAKLWEEKKFKQYDYFFFVVNDCEFDNTDFVRVLLQEMQAHPKVGILSPCSRKWGEKKILGEEATKYVHHAHFMAWFVRRDFIECVMEPEEPSMMNFFFDGTNFRGYVSDIELVAKGYANDYATALTTKVWVDENEKYLRTHADLIKTESFDENQQKVLTESKLWMRRKYGFNYRWSMNIYAKTFYDQFFKSFPNYLEHKM